MATPADQRLLELCDKWLKSLELHIRYSSLDTESYWKVQPWPEHQRPSRWIIDLAVQKAVALRSQVHERIKQGDTKFSDSLELMTFLGEPDRLGTHRAFHPIGGPRERGRSQGPCARRCGVGRYDRNSTDAGTRLGRAARRTHGVHRTWRAALRAHRAALHRPNAVRSPRAARVGPAARGAGTPLSGPIGGTRRAAPRRAVAAAAPARAQPSESVGATATREMPQFVAAKRRAPAVGT